MGSLRRKDRYVADGHMTDPPESITYASVVSRESVRIAFMIAALNDLDVQAARMPTSQVNVTRRSGKFWDQNSDQNWKENAESLSDCSID
jgi:hypothetical protein